MRREGDGYIYFVLAEEVARVKIGYTTGVPDARVSDLRTGSPVDLQLVRVIYGDRDLEGDLHEHFQDRRVRGEWFEASVLLDVDAAVLELTHYPASPPWIERPETLPTRNPTLPYRDVGFQGLAPKATDSYKERPSRARSSSLVQPAVVHGRVRVGGNAQTEENA